MEAAVGARGVALAGEHARRILALALEGENAGGIGIAARHILAQQPVQDFAVVLPFRQRDPGHRRAAQALGLQVVGKFAAPDLHLVFVAGIVGLHLRPDLEQLARAGVERRLLFGDQLNERFRAVPVAQHRAGCGKLLALARDLCLFAGPGMVAPHGRRDFRQVARPVGRNDGAIIGGVADVRRRPLALARGEAFLPQGRQQAEIERRHPVVVEAAGDGAVDRHVLRPRAESLAVALDLLGDIAQRVLAALAVEFVDRDEVGIVQHVDLFELAGRAELRRHDIEREVDIGHDAGVALADARRLDDHQVEAGRLAHLNRPGRDRRHLAFGAAGRDGAHVNPAAVDRVHADAVAEQGAAGAPAGRVDGDQRNAQIGLVLAEPLDDLVGQRALAGAARAGDAEDRRADLRRPFSDPGRHRLRQRPALQAGDQPGDDAGMGGVQRVEIRRRSGSKIDVGGRQHVGDHARQPQVLPIVRAVDAGHAVIVQFADFLGHDGAAAAAEHLDMARPELVQPVDHVFEELDMAALVGRDGDTVGILLDRRLDDLVDRAVVAEMNDLRALRLHDAPHDVDRRVVPVEQRRRRHEADGILQRGTLAGRSERLATVLRHAKRPPPGRNADTAR